jgi:hypothetical protein
MWPISIDTDSSADYEVKQVRHVRQVRQVNELRQEGQFLIHLYYPISS